MRIYLIISSTLHVAVVAAAFFVLPETEKFEVKKSEVIQAETISESQFAKLTEKPDEKKPEEKPKPKPEPEKKPKPKKKKVKKTPPPPPPPPPPEPEPVVEAPPEPKPPEPKVEAPPLPKPPEPKEEPKKEPEKKKAEVKPVPKSVPIPRVRPKFARKKPKKKRKFDPQKMAALLDKLPEDTAEETSPQFSGRSATISASDRDLMRQKVGRCWNTPVGAEGAEKFFVKIKIRLKRDGSLARPPQVLNSNSDIALDSAMRAVRRCVPYDMFPPKKYNTWRDIVLSFDPSGMF